MMRLERRRIRLAVPLLAGVAASCADFIGPDPGGAGGSAATSTGIGVTGVSATTTGGGGGGAGGDPTGGGGSGPAGPVTSLSVGRNHACAVVDGNVWCWGSNEYAAIGVLPKGCFGTPQQVAISGAPIAEVGVGNEHTCARSTTGGVWCWGTNSAGQVAGLGSVGGLGGVYNEPHPLQSLAEASHLSSGADYNCIVSAANEVWCWGGNLVGQSAPGQSDETLPPTKLTSSLSGSLRVSAGGGETCVSNGTTDVQCFGYNDDIHGRDGQACSAGVAATFLLPKVIQALSVGAQQACARFDDGTYECWGSVPTGSCLSTTWCQNATDGCVLSPPEGMAEVVTSTEGYWCVAGRGVDCAPSPLPSSSAPQSKTFMDLGMANVSLLSASGTGYVCASDSYEIACWGPQITNSVLCNVPANEIVSITIP
jgi:hypothetical protein